MVRLGSISYVNSLPVDWGLVSGAVPMEGDVISGAPSELNRLMEWGELDVSPVSAICYARNSSRWLLLPDFSISSESGIRSVILLSRVPMERLNGRKIITTGEGETTPALLTVLLKEAHGIKNVHLCLGDPEKDFFLRGAEAAACLLIGDWALREAHRKGRFRVYDLSQKWRLWARCPFVFAVWAVRNEFYENNKRRVAETKEVLIRSRAWGQDHPDEVMNEALRRTGIGQAPLAVYYRKLRYDFGADLVGGMRRFFDMAYRQGLLGEPVKLRFAAAPASAA